MGPNDGWLYRTGDLILGPVPAKQIIDKLFSGDVSPATEVKPLSGGPFRRMADVPEFKVHVAKSQAHARVETDAAAHKAATQKRILTVSGIVLGVLLVVGVVVAVIGNYLAVHSPAEKSVEELAFGDLEITLETPTVSRARRSDDDEYIDYPGIGAGKRPADTAVAARTPTTPRTPTNTAHPTTKPPVDKPKLGTPDSDGMQMGEVDQDAINAVIAKNRHTLNGCLKLAYKAGQLVKVPMDFVVGSDGRVAKLWVDNPDLKNGPVQDCLFKELQKWPFKAQGSGGANVQLSFNVGKKG